MDIKSINTIIKAKDVKESEAALTIFLKSTEKVFFFPELNKDNLREEIWKALYKLITSSNDSEVIAESFTAVRVLSREKAYLNELINVGWMELIIKHSQLFDESHKFTLESEKVAVEVEKCLCNLIFNSTVAAAMTCKNGIMEAVCGRTKRYKEPLFPMDIKYFDMKLLFLITALCPEVRCKVKDKHLKYLIQTLELILSEAGTKIQNNESTNMTLSDKDVDLTCEILKTLFNLTVKLDENDEEETDLFKYIVTILRKFILISTTKREKTHMLTNNIINLLTNIPNKCYNSLIVKENDPNIGEKKCLFEGCDMSAYSEILIILGEKFQDDSGCSQNELLFPILTVLYKGACSSRIARKYLKSQVLPPLKDVLHRPEEGSSIRNYLCKLLTSPTMELRDIAAEFLFVLCKKSVNRMIKYTGYGNAAGLFAHKGLLGGKHDKGAAEYSSESEDSETEEYAKYKHGINPILGCYEAPHASPMANMTEEQKEYEAMKLVELMDNLTKIGSIKPCKIGEDGRPQPIEHVLQLQAGLKDQQIHRDQNEDSN